MQALDQYLARTLKTQRKEKGWSLDRAAKETGVSKAMLGQIERGESSPTVATLWKIASGFHLSLSTFLEPPVTDTEQTVIRSSAELRRQPASDQMLVAALFPFEPRFGFELFELTLLPGYERLAEPHEKGVTEHVIVTGGEMELLVDGQWLTLKQGAAVRFAADQAHGYRNLHQAPAVFHSLIHYP
ncbi:helix-turn-helix domain-containing protein [Thalassomonas actiniarum]|uniref:Helix-turn-helix transcriptional regulator n=1 Tax=Thalassomonas actiniarum TaxID=485447 RepID=A0AAF0C434_9GAMM|nr:XRE family transcriptional regulator [Thalassomonas actiniarum]WDE01857.1 helix-turn-helix transcriptional regulator [Thalassomonas actiniarum]